MALWPLFSVPDCIQYSLWDGVTHLTGSNLYLITPPRIYQEAVRDFYHFYYEPGRDRLCAWAMLDTYHWPGWGVRRYDFDSETGAFLGQGGGSIWAVAWVNNGSLGSYGAIYATWNSGSQITEMDADAMQAVSGMWSTNPGSWNPSRYFYHAIVNREDNLVAGVSGSSKDLEIWDIAGAPYKRGSLHLPYFLGYLTYESRSICWIITSNGLVGKCNYRMSPPRWEMLSSVQNPAPDAKGYYVAFDPKRNRLAVLRWLPDAEDGACRCQIEFYRPLYRIAGLTDPVPVTRLRTGERVRFVAHLYGDSGEGAGTYPVRGEMVAPPAGALLTPITSTEQSGAASLRYQAPEGAATETLSLSATVED